MRRAYLTWAFLLAAGLAGVAEAGAALAPNYQRLAELRAILDDPAVIAAFGAAPITGVTHLGSDTYLVVSETCRLSVRIVGQPLPAGMVGPRRFSVRAGKASCRDGR